MRGLLIDGWKAGQLALGFGVAGLLGLVTLTWATRERDHRAGLTAHPARS